MESSCACAYRHDDERSCAAGMQKKYIMCARARILRMLTCHKARNSTCGAAAVRMLCTK